MYNKLCQTCKQRHPATIVRTWIMRERGREERFQHQCVFCIAARNANRNMETTVTGPQLQELWDEQGGRCAYTNEPIRLDVAGAGSGAGKVPSDKATIDHIIPKSKGGTNAVSNIVWCSSRANGVKGNRRFEEMLERLQIPAEIERKMLINLLEKVMRGS